MLKIAILASTNGTDMQAIIDEAEAGKLDADLAIVIANKECGAIERAKKHKIKTLIIDPKGKEREEYDTEVAAELDEEEVELILLIGYMRYVSEWFVDKYRNRIMNIHPSLLPAFAGGMDKNVHQEVLDHGCKVTGCTLHFVDEGADTGPIIAQAAVPIDEDETIDSLKDKVQKEEQRLLIQGIKWFIEDKLIVEGKIVRIG
ncbi:MAG: phosphoribosylglycinamide formyltransferase [archaeon]